ncbi:MAG: hypothetical protein LC723_13930 [Actinobacteria bacterium]|nr:hypothetical protein [Actinomycetota bacterium]
MTDKTQGGLRISIPYDLADLNNDDNIDLVAEELMATLEDLAEAVNPTPSEVLSGVFTLLDRLLRGNRRMSGTPAADALELQRALGDLLTEFGRVPS